MPPNSQIVVVVWKKLSRRSELLAEAVKGMLWFFKDTNPYIRAALRTLHQTITAKPRNIIVQLPQGPLLLEALLLKKLIHCKVIADVHTGFLFSTDWKGRLLNMPFVKLLHHADLVVAHNDSQLNIIPQNAKDKTVVMADPWHLIPVEHPRSRGTERYIVFPASFASDEPLEEVINSINTSNIDVKMYITGNWNRKPEIKKYESNRIKLTGFLPAEQYGALLANATAIISGTNREYTTLMSAGEALVYIKPLALTATQTLKNLYGEYAVFYDHKNKESIAEAIEKILREKPNLSAREKLKQRNQRGINALREHLRN